MPRLNSEKIDVRSIENFPVEIIYDGYKFSVDEKFIVTYVGEANETIITYITEPEGYTNKDEVKILIKVANPKGIKTIEYPDGDKLICNGRQEVGIDYKVNKNGSYTFKIVDNTDKEITKDIVIEKIDKERPKEFTPTVENINATILTIVANAQDSDETEESVKSGIGRYEYYIKEATALEYKKYETTDDRYEVDNLEPNTEYDIYVVAYDKANNYKMSSTIKEKTIIGPKDIYISGIHGNNSFGDGSQEKPYRSLNKITEAGIIKKGIPYNIYVQNGTHEIDRKLFELDYDNEINIYGNKENTILNVRRTNDTSHAEGNINYTVNFYRLVWNDIETDRTNVIGLRNTLNFNNIYFKIKEQSNYAYFMVAGGSQWSIKNCTLGNNTKEMIRVTNGAGSIKLTNCYGGFSSGYNTSNSSWNYQTNYITSTPQVDKNYRITDDESVWKDVGTGTDPDGSQADLGVYGGEYSWER